MLYVQKEYKIAWILDVGSF